jgi:hypothetical protein
MKLSRQVPLIVHIIAKYKITHYQYLILHNREFRSFGNRKNNLKSTTVTLQGNDVLWRTINLGQQISDISKKSMQATIYCHYD